MLTQITIDYTTLKSENDRNIKLLHNMTYQKHTNSQQINFVIQIFLMANIILSQDKILLEKQKEQNKLLKSEIAALRKKNLV